MSWLSSFWKHNRNFIGNTMKNVAPAAFLIPGAGPGLAALIGGAGAALGRGIQEGGNLRNILGAGAGGAALAYTGSKLTDPTGQGKSLQKLKGLFGGGGGGGNAASAAAKAAPTSFNPASGAGMPGTQLATPLSSVSFTPSSSALIQGPSAAALPAAAGGGGGFSLAGAAKGAGQFVQDNPIAAGMGLQAAGQYAQSRVQAGQNEWERKRVEEWDAQERKRQEELRPLYELWKKRMMNQYSSPPTDYSRA